MSGRVTRLLKNVWHASEKASCLEEKHCTRTTRFLPFILKSRQWLKLFPTEWIYFSYFYLFQIKVYRCLPLRDLDLQRLGRANCSCVHCEGTDWQVLLSLLYIDWSTTKLSYKSFPMYHSFYPSMVCIVSHRHLVKWQTLCHRYSYDGRDDDGSVTEVTW
jgi:hypothetical protein